MRTKMIMVRLNQFEEERLMQFMKMEGETSYSRFFRKKAIENTYFQEERLKQILKRLESIEGKI